jgi:phosphopantetheinyl transferase (holo-ACP synthase)
LPVGNDIVDLRDPESAPESLHPRYLHRVFTAVERKSLAAHPGRLELWSRWAAKEAAYKALATERAAQRSKLVFSPRAFATVLDPPGVGSHRRGWVVHRVLGERLSIRLHISDDAVHAVAASAGELDGERVIAVSFPLDSLVRDIPSLAVRRAARGLFAQHLGCDERRVRIRGRRPPQFFIDGQPGGSSLSLSHHGRWVAFAFSRVSPRRRRPEPSHDGRFLQI